MIRELKGNIILGFVVAGNQTKGVVRRVWPRSTRRCLLVVQKTWAVSCGNEIQMDGYISWCDPTDGGEKDNGPHTPPLETSHPCRVPQRRPHSFCAQSNMSNVNYIPGLLLLSRAYTIHHERNSCHSAVRLCLGPEPLSARQPITMQNAYPYFSSSDTSFPLCVTILSTIPNSTASSDVMK